MAFIDEIFKANSAILNALLTLLNERLFDNGNQRLRVPLLCLVSRFTDGISQSFPWLLAMLPSAAMHNAPLLQTCKEGLCSSSFT